MKNIDLKTIIIIALGAIILFLKMCSGPDTNTGSTVKINGKKYVVVKHTIDTVYQPVTQTVYRDGKTIYVDVPVYVEVPSNIDTGEVIKDYFAKYTYKDTLRLKDSLGFIAVTDTIFKNRILNRVFDAKVNKITVKEVIYLEPAPKAHLYLGGTFGSAGTTPFIAPSLMLETKKNRIYKLSVGYSYDLKTDQKNYLAQFGLLWRIQRKK
jgi:hypothetical protein